MSERIIAATDGSCDPNPGPCAWAYVIADADGGPARTVSGALGHGTNQVAELAAVLALLEDTTGPVTIYADSVYAIRCLTTWLPNWQRNGWLNSSKKPVANRHLIEQAAALMVGRDVQFTWVRGHNGHPLNEAADQAAKYALTAPVHRTFAPAPAPAPATDTDMAPAPATVTATAPTLW
ncbi:ribonuclease H family protein [Streptomyces iconiensis]|uniref:Ribonuclease H n=1 Tax=Streptomyces iconiensis TaxID=1384038 RepID=A0ABT7A6R6_9ACTN|nr:ribonuclease H [Streptomyces iconiensis]MDJ1137044.1 ribonuclease H [Streptomyces iconiensis]